MKTHTTWRRVFAHPAVGLLLSIALIAPTTRLLLFLQQEPSSETVASARPFAILFLLPIALITLSYGTLCGTGALAMALLATLAFLFPGGWGGKPEAFEVFALAAVGAIVVAAIGTGRRWAERARIAQIDAEEAAIRLRVMMDTAPTGVMTTAPDGTLDFANKEAERIWGRPFKALGQSDWGYYRVLDLAGDPLPPGKSAIGRVLAGHPGVIENEVLMERGDGTRVRVHTHATGVRDESGKLLGGLSIITDVTEQRANEAERERLLREAQERAEREALLNRIGEAQRASEDPDQVQTVAVAALGRALSADRCFFATYEIERGEARVTRDWHVPDLPDLAGDFTPAELGLTGDAAFADPTPRVQNDDDPARPFSLLGLRAAITVPIFSDADLVATLTVASVSPRVWTDTEVRFVEAVAAQTRATLRAAALLQRERTIAIRLQEALMPELPERVPGLDLDKFYRAALAEANVGGDFYDVFLLGQNRIALVVGDLSGKGLAAASQVATVRSMLRYALYRSGNLSDCLRDLNDTVSERRLLAGFVTLFVGILDTATGRMTYVSCGHEPGLVRHAATGAIEELESTGPVLGAFSGVPFDQADVLLVPGDILALYTDGLSEAGRSRHDFLGVAGLAGLLQGCGAHRPTASALIRCLVDGVQNHARENLHDDACLLVGVVE